MLLSHSKYSSAALKIASGFGQFKVLNSVEYVLLRSGIPPRWGRISGLGYLALSLWARLGGIPL